MKLPFKIYSQFYYLALAIIFSCACDWQLQAQPTIVSVVPANGASGVSPSASVVFTFSAAMNTSATDAQFNDGSSGFTNVPTAPSWSAGNTVLTCTATPSFPPNHFIFWSV